MGKAVLISILPQWVHHIFFEKDKIYEVRKRAPLLVPPYTVYVYCTLKYPYLHYESMFWKGTLNGLVVGKFTCVGNLERSSPWEGSQYGTCLSPRKLAEYSKGKNLVFMQIDSPILFDKPKELKEFGVTRPPQNFQFVEEIENG